MSTEQSKSVARRFFEEQDRLRGGPAPELCAPTYTARIASNPPLDLAGHQQFAAMFYGAFPDLYHTIDDLIGEGERAVVRFGLHGTHTSDFMGIPATQKRVDVSAIAFLRIVDGRVAELIGEFDQLGMLQQLGAIPAPEPAGA